MEQAEKAFEKTAVTPADYLARLSEVIGEERDRKLEAARKQPIPFHSNFGLCDKPSPHDAAKSLSRMNYHCVSQARKIPFVSEPRQWLHQ